ncbi:trypsin-2-like [Hyposmocoma kahamanoa]|uniref:trypsin-2-like n=1 Tax=Hyposmocoma kahamanoa TaxID=1477025 RepID=UPI000E6D67B6|nr:trypsin-2-like [Hyposmocoma kahamanoa]
MTSRADVLGDKHRRQFKSFHDGKIVGGYNTTIQNIPYQAYLLLQKGNDYYQCGGSIISNRYILTAAHCLKGIQRAYIRIGSTQANSGGTMYNSALLQMHPQYNSQTSDYDVGVIRVSRAMTLDGTKSRVIKLADSEMQSEPISPGTEILVSGWGTTSENGETSNNLMAVTVPTVSNEDCNKSYRGGITARMFCAGVPEGGKDSCQGDSGGPAVQESEDKQLGIVSFGIGCARAGYPGVYTRVASVRNWIRLNTGV